LSRKKVGDERSVSDRAKRMQHAQAQKSPLEAGF